MDQGDAGSEERAFIGDAASSLGRFVTRRVKRKENILIGSYVCFGRFLSANSARPGSARWQRRSRMAGCTVVLPGTSGSCWIDIWADG
ncbi:hypothetical protein V6N11_001450 [Hibiscus sabdariffa]|uniref:Uncharacterized protein n=1 Tax=Hibiscus sabdariffa TaxID=183260 RepID=A0ABR2RZS5_9ROSI